MRTSQIVTDLIERSGLSKAELARRAGISRALLHGYACGNTEPSLPQLQRIASAAGHRIDVTLRPARADEFIAVLDFGSLFPTREPDPLPDMRHVWRSDAA